MVGELVSTSLPSPLGGWNARDALGEMEATDAVYLINYFPYASYVGIRKGYSQYSTGLPSQVESVMAYASPTSRKLLAASGSAIYDVTSGGAVGAAAVTGLTNARWQHVNISTSGGSFMYMVNGADKPLLYNGSTFVAVDGVSTPAITGVTTTSLVHVNLFKKRLWFVEKNTLNVWYLPVDAVGGAANALNFQSIARRGGYLVAMGTWTIDAGEGVDDMAVFATSEGEVIVYKGTDPSSASTWALVGVWQLGAPIGRRCFYKYSGDLLYISQDGVLPLSGALQSSRVNPRVALTDKIQSAMSTAATTYGSNFGWQLIYYAKQNALMLNVPVVEGSSQEQYVMNTITKSFAQFQGWSANCWEIFADEPYFGGNGYVGKAWDTLADNSTNVNGNAKQAFNYFGSPGLQKNFELLRPILLTNGAPNILASVNVDFQDDTPTNLLSFSPSSASLWDSAIWDSSTWGSGLNVSKEWQGATDVGYCAAVRFQSASQGIELRWVSTDIVFKKGGIL